MTVNTVYTQKVDPFKLAKRGEQIEGRIPLASLKRLNEIQAQAANEASFGLSFSTDPQGIAYVRGQIQAQVVLICQRCLEPYEQHISTEFILSPVTNDKEAAKLPAPYEALLVEKGMVELAAIIEDELLLNLPIIAKHVLEDCLLPASYSTTPAGVEFVDKKPNPFTSLANLKTNK